VKSFSTMSVFARTPRPLGYSTNSSQVHNWGFPQSSAAGTSEASQTMVTPYVVKGVDRSVTNNDRIQLRYLLRLSY
jgi:hypothetical protein